MTTIDTEKSWTCKRETISTGIAAKATHWLRRVLGGIIISGVSVVCGQAQIINGGFETGNLTGWTSSPGSLTNVVSSRVGLGITPPWLPTEGVYFAYLRAGEEGVYTTIYQEFAAAAGSRLEFDVFFDTPDSLPWNDDGFVELINTETLATVTLYARSVSTVGPFGHDGWSTISHVFPAAGNYQLVAGVRNVLDNSFPSALGLDRITLGNLAAEVELDVEVDTWFTDPEGDSLPSDGDGNDSIEVVTRGSVVVVATNPGQLLAWVSVAPKFGLVNSLVITDFIPESWGVHPSWDPAEGGVHVYYSDGMNLTELIVPDLISASPGASATVELSLPSLPDLIGKALAPGESILLGIKTRHGGQLAGAYPRTNQNAASAEVYSEENFAGSSASADAKAIFNEVLKR